MAGELHDPSKNLFQGNICDVKGNQLGAWVNINAKGLCLGLWEWSYVFFDGEDTACKINGEPVFLTEKDQEFRYGHIGKVVDNGNIGDIIGNTQVQAVDLGNRDQKIGQGHIGYIDVQFQGLAIGRIVRGQELQLVLYPLDAFPIILRKGALGHG